MAQKVQFYFQIISKFKNEKINLPRRQTFLSAGYDLESAIDVQILPRQTVLVPTGIKAFFDYDKVLCVYARSSLIKKNLMLSNGVGIIDSDYYNNTQNEGHIFVALYNLSDKNAVLIQKNERIAQCILQNFYLTKNDLASKRIRDNGFGSTNEKK
ncbi:dUTP diphosphatase [Candidatus Phytoplasma pini]|uniref:dUTP diphosphatase n=1 Tax=Candidatus Phytoplasma pini TaxID=267362 RepID=A0A559KJX3_9MOLU|nr:dUTP diphosphatase [Candidatus Phytoplasma pini]TVY12432.1 Deoxyuridine 5'-triphosphate nucleotidohydrolase [Candidatus Phytoplasma pini]